MAENHVSVTKVVVVGHVDHGKSTLLGRVLLDCGRVPEDKIENVRKICESKSLQFEPAFIFDALQEEQEQGISIDTTRVFFEFEGEKFVLIDAPGHLEFLKNMTSGASEANIGILVVDCNQGIRSQTERHLRILSMLGISHVLVAMNKIDQIDYDQTEFERIAAQVKEIIDGLGLTLEDVVPIAALHGENMTVPSEKLGWYLGKPLLPRLMQLSHTRNRVRIEDEPFRMFLQDVYRFGGERYFVGRVIAGSVSVGTEVFFSPSGKMSTIEAIQQFPDKTLQRAVKGDSIALKLGEQIFVERGEIVSTPDQLPIVDTELRARIVWLSSQPFKPENEYLIKLGVNETSCRVHPTIKDGQDGQEKWAATVSGVTNGSFMDVVIKASKQLAFDPQGSAGAVSQFVLCTTFETVAAGVIDALPARKERELTVNPNLRRESGYVDRSTHEIRNGHRGAVLWLTGLSGAGKSTLAKSLENDLFQRGCNTVVLDGDNLRLGLCADLSFTPEDRSENIRRIAHAAKLFLDRGFVVITAAISPYSKDREVAKEIIGADDFHEIFVFCPMEECQRRDPKGLYKKASSGQVRAVTGFDSPYQPPQRPELRLDSSNLTVEEEVSTVLDLLLGKGVLTPPEIPAFSPAGAPTPVPSY